MAKLLITIEIPAANPATEDPLELADILLNHDVISGVIGARLHDASWEVNA